MSPRSSLARILPNALSKALSASRLAGLGETPSSSSPLRALPSAFRETPQHSLPPPSSASPDASRHHRFLFATQNPGSTQSQGSSRTTVATHMAPSPSGSAAGAARLMSGSADGSSVYSVGSSTNIKWHETKVDKDVRQALLKQKGCVIWMTGLSGSGKSTLAYTLEHALVDRGHLAYVLDGDNIRHGLNKNLGFTAADREENIRRVGEVAKLFADAGVITIVSFISPYRRDRLAARDLLTAGDFLEVYMKIPLSVCEDRDPKGLYKLARAGKIKGFTGIDDPYEEPDNAEVVIEVSKEDGVLQAPEVMAQTMMRFLESKGFVPPQ